MEQKPAVLLWQKLLIVLLLTVAAVSSYRERFSENTYSNYVTPTPDTPCPGDPCLTLSQYAEQYYWNNFSSNTTLVFLPGDHTLNVTISMGTVSHYTAQLDGTLMKYFYYPHPSLTLLGSPSSLPEVTSRIVCSRPAGFIFSGINELHISSLAFISCRHNDKAAVNMVSVQNINISNCSFQNNTNSLPWSKGTTGDYGGAMYVYNSTLTLAENTFQNNSAGNGGAVYADRNNILILLENTFQKNSANERGGALHAHTNNILTLSENTFLDNSAGVGGAVLVNTNNTLTLSRNTFQNNSADISGGALYADTNNILTLSDNTFQNNSGIGGGALVARTNNTLTLSENTFLNNSADVGGAVWLDTNNTLTLSRNTFQNTFAGYGGTVYADTNNILVLSENTFQNNSANDSGGALHAGTNNTLTLSENTFLNNSADVGGAILVDINNILTLSGNTFQNNSADYYGSGGALYAYTTNTLTLSENTFLSNSADYGSGGALYAYTNNTLTLSEDTFLDNSAYIGGAVLVDTNNTLTLSGNTFQNNFADISGIGLYADTNNTLTLSGNTFQNNSGIGEGALVAGTNNTLTLSENTFLNNSAYFGGAVLVDSNNTLTLLGNTFQNNSVVNFGGALVAVTNNALTLSGNTFQKNSADISGMALYAEINNTLNLSDNTFQNNSGIGGGALFAHTNNALTLSGNTFQRNSVYFGGGAVWVDTNNTLTLSGNTFQDNSAVSTGGALIALKNNTLTLSGNTFQNNSVHFGGGALYVGTNNTLTLSENTFHNNSADISGGGLYVDTNNTGTITNSGYNGGALMAYTNNTFTLSANTFQNNFAGHGGGALYVIESTMYFADNNLTRNAAQSGGGAIFCSHSILRMYGSHRLQNNTSQYGGGIAALGCQIVLAGDALFEGNKANFGGALYIDQSNVSGYANFSNNSANVDGGAIYASRSTFRIKELITFLGNSALNGGGLLFTEGSKLFLQPNTTINFTNNFVKQKGGAINVENINPLSNCVEVSCALLTGSDCFFQVETQRQYGFATIISEIVELHNARIYFQNNTALEAGAALYGGSIDNCRPTFIVTDPLSVIVHIPDLDQCPQVSSEVFDYITSYGEPSLDISSDPLYICTCEDGEPDCSVSSIARSVYPGGRIEVPIIAYGQRKGTTPAVIRNHTPTSEITTVEPESTQHITNICSFLNYTVQTYAIGTTQEMTLYAQGPCSPKERTFSSVPTNVVKVRVSILPCPPGFELLQKQPACTCAQRLQQFTKTCRIDDRKIERNTEFWVGYIRENTSDGLILHPHCPFDYCKTPNKTYITVDDSDEQCSNNRTGLLCGKCSQNFSLALGNNHCLQCSNGYLWLIVAFAFAGVALVFFLFILRLTVAVGTMNGLLFYANTFSMNSAIFFRAQMPNVLTVFMAWLNLDLGIETCFYNGMDAYAKAWLQFVFPFYVWTLVGIIILVGHYSSKVATILGTNPIAVLATLFLLSYTKFLRTIIVALSYTVLEFPNNSKIAVWLYDGNIRYLSNKHIPLFIAALVFLVILFLPFTIFLMFSQWLRSKSGQWKMFHWVNNHRVLPLLDAYHAPYTDKHRYWTGLMLVVRCILFLLFAFNVLGDPSVNLLAIGSVTAVLLIVYALFGNRIYKNWYLNVLELSFLANLCILVLATFYIRSTGGSQNVVTITSISIAFATFIGVVTYHSAQQIKHIPQLWRKVFPRNYIYELVPQTDEGSDLQGISPPSPPDPSDGCVTVTHINLRELLDRNELREPCMDMAD